ncbi:hypothetical protein [Azospirillum argentinense]|uniref:Uncharacterized protein n=1 Tax=Azospirillum brasilense TaxID=192 RepID=A0A4D8QGW5_AZOBR|nr:hypothetical protein [Azospirillum argentinense]QCO07470.1 hypothetical protein D3867_36925 [Azospirillum argentinense]
MSTAITQPKSTVPAAPGDPYVLAAEREHPVTRWKVAEYRLGVIDEVAMGFERFRTDDLITDPRDEVPDLLDAIKTGKTAVEDVDGEIEWWNEWGQRKHEALASFNRRASKSLQEEIGHRLVAEGDYEASVMIIERAVEALDAADRAKNADSFDTLLAALKDFDEACLSGVEPDVYGLNLMDLPTFGGNQPADTGDIYSWDETRVLSCADGRWAIGEREDGDEE